MMDKTFKLWAIAVAICTTCFFGCGSNTNTKEESAATQETETQQEVVAIEEQTCITAVEKYIVDSIGCYYAPGQICIPYPNIVKIDETNADDIRVWGDFWVYLYDLSGDTLKVVSGGRHPGLMHVKKTDNTFEVTNFDAVEDGSNNLESAKAIFGENYDAFHAISSNDVRCEENLLNTTAEYVKKHGIKATLRQDYGWPAKSLPVD